MTLRRASRFWGVKGGAGDFGPILYTPPLDVYTGAKRAYGFRLLRTAYTGPLFRLQRFSVGDFIDVYPESNGLVDLVGLYDWINSSVFVQTYIEHIYDQTGNGFGMPQTSTGSNKPYILPNAGAFSDFITINSKLALKTEGGAFSDSIPFMYGSSANSFIAVIQGPNTNLASSCLVAEGRSSTTNPAYLHLKWSIGTSVNATHFLRNDANTVVVTSSSNNMGSLYDNSPHICYSRDNSSNFRVVIDDVSDINVNYTRSGALTLNRFGLLCWSTTTNRNGFNDLKLAEIILYDSNQDSNASGLISTLNSYYGTY